jgi:hypothetical protein
MNMAKPNGRYRRVIASSITPLLLSALALTAGQKATKHTDTAKPALALVVAAETTTLKSGEAVPIRTVLTNNSKQPFDASACYCGPAGLDSLFKWEVRENGRLIAKRTYPHPELATGEIILDRVVQPGGELSGSQDINRLYDMTKPAKYTIQAIVELPKQMGGGTPQSNEITVTVIPKTTVTPQAGGRPLTR